MTNKEKFGQRMRQLRIQKKLSQEKLAEKSGLHRTYIGTIERGEKNISIEGIVKISNGLNISLSEFFSSDIFK